MYKVPKGTQDFAGRDYEKLQTLIQQIEQSFRQSGGVPLDTPVFERTDVLLGKYGEEAESKLIYKLAEEGGESLALRYDLTVPFMRHIKECGVKQMRRYSIGKVYRRDQPNVKHGRFREFIQADFDLYGEKQEGMLSEITVLNTVVRVFKELGLGFTLYINDINNLQYILVEKVGIQNWKNICPIIDKLDKQSFDSLVPEFQAVGCSLDQIKALEEILKCPTPMYEPSCTQFSELLSLAEVFGFEKQIVFQNSLARGLDYYTGFIWEFKVEGLDTTVSAGGRYDSLLGAPTVGISIGVNRLALCISDSTSSEWKEAYRVTSLGNVDPLDKLRIAHAIEKKTTAPVTYSLTKEDKKLSKVITDACTSFTRYVVIVAEDELARGQYIIKDLKLKTQALVDL